MVWKSIIKKNSQRPDKKQRSTFCNIDHYSQIAIASSRYEICFLFLIFYLLFYTSVLIELCANLHLNKEVMCVIPSVKSVKQRTGTINVLRNRGKIFHDFQQDLKKAKWIMNP